MPAAAGRTSDAAVISRQAALVMMALTDVLTWPAAVYLRGRRLVRRPEGPGPRIPRRRQPGAANPAPAQGRPGA